MAVTPSELKEHHTTGLLSNSRSFSLSMPPAGTVLGCRMRDPQSKGRHRCQLLCSGHPFVLLSWPVNYVGVSWRRFRGLDSKPDARNLCDRKFSPGTNFVAQRKSDVLVCQAPDLALCESLHTKHRSLVVTRGRVECPWLHPTRRSGVMPALSEVAARHFAGCRIRSQAAQRDAQNTPI